jgi:predicted nucleotidyltransferase
MGKVIEGRKKFSEDRFVLLRTELTDAPKICSDKACVYATGSFGRREASEHSDLDLFIVALDDKESQTNDRGKLTRLDEILLKAELIRAARALRFPEFSKDGRFLQHHTSGQLIEATGKPDDDALNTFTARLLLLLESRALIGEEVHSMVINEVIAEYWEEFPSHLDRFMPTYLANDILRYWRTLCLNYEANTSEDTPVKRAKRKLTNYKLKHSRMLTCFSALLALLNEFVRNCTVTVANAQKIVQMTPTERMAWVQEKSVNESAASKIREILDLYERFLDVTGVSEKEQIELFSDETEARTLRDEQSRFGDLVYEALFAVGKDNDFYRRLVV